MGLMGKLACNDTSNIGMIFSDLKHVSIKFLDQCTHIMNNEERLNELKGSTKLQNRSSIFKCQSSMYSVQRNYYINHRDMKIQWNTKLFPSFNFINVNSSPYGIKDIIWYYHYWSDSKLGPGIVVIRIIPCIFHACTKIWSLSWESKIRSAVNQPRTGIVYYCKYSQSIGCYTNWIIMGVLDDGIDE